MSWHVFRVENYDYLVGIVAKKYRWMSLHGRVDWDDLMQVGRIGVMHACSKFDPSRGVKFSTYAIYWVHSHIQRINTGQAFAVYMPAYLYFEKRKNGEQLPGTVYLDRTDTRDSNPLKDRIPSRERAADIQFDEFELESTAKRLLSSIDPRRAEVIKRIVAGETRAAVAKSMGLSRERVRQLYDQGIEMCRKHELALYLREFAETA